MRGVLEEAVELTWQWGVILQAPDGHHEGMHAMLGS